VRLTDLYIHLSNNDSNPCRLLTGSHRQPIFGDYTPICQNYELVEFDQVVDGIEVAKIVHVQVNWNSTDPVAEI